jgi:UDP-4-amino-4-deoxy-L-arabinose-oxoglutarate aminotransferase
MVTEKSYTLREEGLALEEEPIAASEPKTIPHSKPWLTTADLESVVNVIKSGMLARGKGVSAFEKAVCAYTNSIMTVALSSGTAALVFALRAIGVRTGDEVVLPTYVCGSVMDAVVHTGLTPRLCDIGEETWNLTPETVAEVLSRKTAAIIVPHIFGIPVDVQGIEALGVPVIEDCAQAFGAKLDDRQVGTAGLLGVYSFNATKCLTSGEGGMVAAGSEAGARLLKSALQKKTELPSPMSDLQATLGLAQLARYNEFLRRRRSLADVYFKELPLDVTARLAAQPEGGIFFRFPLYWDFDFDNAVNFLAARKITARKGVDALLHRRCELQDSRYPNAVEALRKTLSIPIYPSLTLAEAEEMSQAVRSLFGKT